jgi:polysaccharide biosynthesis transport protein
MSRREPLLSSHLGEMRVQRSSDEELRAVGLNSAGYGRTAASEPPPTVFEYLSILNRGKRRLLLYALLGTLLGFLLTRAQSPVYRARTLISIENLNEDFLNMRNVSTVAPEATSEPPEYNIRTQLAVLQSRPVLERALQQGSLENRLLAEAHRRKFPWSKIAWSKIAPAAPESPLLLRNQAMSTVTAGLQVRPQPNTRVVEVSFDCGDPQIAADLANSVISAFNEVSLENRWSSIQNTSQWLTRQLQDVKTKLERSEDAVQKYARESDLTFLSDAAQNTTSEERLRQLQLELSKAEADRVETQSRYEQANEAPADSLPEVVDNPTLRDYQVQLTALRRQLADLSASFTPNYPKVISLRSQIAAVEAALEKERANVITRTRNQYESAVKREKLVKNDYRAVITLMAREADKLNHYSLLKREVDTTRQLYDSMVQRVKEADLASAMKATEIHVIESAVPPSRRYKPNAVINVGLGLLSGVLFGAVTIIHRARSNSTIQEPGETVIELNVPELGVIPAASMQKRFQLPRLLADSPSGIVSHDRGTRIELPHSMLAESFRITLAAIILSSKDGFHPRTIAFSSANSGEGKTTVTANLGITLAHAGRRVLLIDADLRKRRLHRIFEVNSTPGIIEALNGGSPPAVRETKIANLFVLPSGKGAADKMLFFSSKLHELLETLKTEFDMMLIDTPPLLQVADARLICSQADRTVLVIAQHTPRETALLARQYLADDGSHLLGTVLNNWDPKTSLHAYPSYPKYYKSYYSETQA